MWLFHFLHAVVDTICSYYYVLLFMLFYFIVNVCCILYNFFLEILFNIREIFKTKTFTCIWVTTFQNDCLYNSRFEISSIFLTTFSWFFMFAWYFSYLYLLFFIHFTNFRTSFYIVCWSLICKCHFPSYFRLSNIFHKGQHIFLWRKTKIYIFLQIKHKYDTKWLSLWA